MPYGVAYGCIEMNIMIQFDELLIESNVSVCVFGIWYLSPVYRNTDAGINGRKHSS